MALFNQPNPDALNKSAFSGTGNPCYAKAHRPAGVRKQELNDLTAEFLMGMKRTFNQRYGFCK